MPQSLVTMRDADSQDKKGNQNITVFVGTSLLDSENE